MKSLDIIRRLPSYQYHGEPWYSSRHAVGYVLAFFTFATALSLRFSIDALLPDGFPFITFYPAIVFATFIAGVWPGLFAAVLCALASWYFFVPPERGFALDAAAIVALSFFVLVACVNIALMNVAFSAFKEAAQLGKENKLMSDHQSLLLRELDHRIKNLFAIVASVIKLSARDAKTPQQLAEDATERILAISRSHNSMLRVGEGAGLGAADVARQALKPYFDQHVNRIHLDIGSEPMDVQLVQVLSLVLHELATNSVKYGALGNEDGEVHLKALTPEDGSSDLRLMWEETWSGLSAGGSRVGFGSQMIERLMSAYGGDFQRSLQDGRLVAHIKLPRAA